jgi:hypothetical protein
MGEGKDYERRFDESTSVRGVRKHIDGVNVMGRRVKGRFNIRWERNREM